MIIQTAFLGDTVLSTVLLRALRDYYVRKLGYTLEINWVGTSAAEQLLADFSSENDGFTIKVTVLKKRGFIEGIKNFYSTVSGFKKMQARSGTFNELYCVHRSPRSLILGAMIGAGKRLAFSGGRFKNLVLKILGYETVEFFPYELKAFPQADANVLPLIRFPHYVDRVLNLLSFHLPLVHHMRKPLLPSIPAEAKSISNAYLILLSPFSVWGTKMWPVDHWRQLVKFLHTQRVLGPSQNLEIGILGSGDSPYGLAGERENANLILGSAGAGKNFVGKTNIVELSHLIKTSKLVVTNDSAAAHIAAAWNTPTVMIYGPTSEKWGFSPLSDNQVIVQNSALNCRPCHIHGPNVCPLPRAEDSFRCMKDLDAQQVFDAIRQVILMADLKN